MTPSPVGSPSREKPNTLHVFTSSLSRSDSTMEQQKDRTTYSRKEEKRHIVRIALKRVWCYLEEYLPLANTHGADFITDLHWETFVPEKSQHQLLTMSQEDLVNLSQYHTSVSCLMSDGDESSSRKLDDKNAGDWLSSFIAGAYDCHLDNTSTLSTISDVVNSSGALQGFEEHSHVTDVISEAMSDKKTHEIEAISGIINTLFRYCKADVVLDVGSGKGYLGCELARHHNLPVLGLDSCDINTRGALQRDGKLARKWNGLTRRKERKRSQNVDKPDYSNISEQVISHVPDYSNTSDQVTSYIPDCCNTSEQVTSHVPDCCNTSEQVTSHIIDCCNTSEQVTSHIPDYSNTSNKVTNHIPDCSNTSDQISSHIPDYSNTSNQVTSHIPDYSNTSNKVTNHIPDCSNTSDQISSHIPDYSNTFEQINIHIPDCCNTSDKVTNHIPDYCNTSDHVTSHILDCCNTSEQVTNHVPKYCATNELVNNLEYDSENGCMQKQEPLLSLHSVSTESRAQPHKNNLCACENSSVGGDFSSQPSYVEGTAKCDGSSLDLRQVSLSESVEQVLCQDSDMNKTSSSNCCHGSNSTAASCDASCFVKTCPTERNTNVSDFGDRRGCGLSQDELQKSLKCQTKVPSSVPQSVLVHTSSGKMEAESCHRVCDEPKTSDLSQMYVPVTLAVTPDMNLHQTLADYASCLRLRSTSDANVLLTGLHTCGSLSVTLMRLFLQNPGVVGLCYVGCCYQLMEESCGDGTSVAASAHFPLSQFGNSLNLHLGRNARNLASQSVARIQVSGQLQGADFCWRAMLNVLLQNLGVPVPERIVGMRGLQKRSRSFQEYAQAALGKLHLNTDLITPELVAGVEEHHKNIRQKMAAFFQVKLIIAPVIETLVLLDRYLYLLEQDSVQDAHIVKLFDPVTSPRCYAIIACKVKHGS